MRRLSSVTPTGMFSSQAANAAAGRLARTAASAHLTIFTIDANAPKISARAAPSFCKSVRPAIRRHALFESKRGRLVHIPHQLLETYRQGLARVLCEKPAHFADAAARLDQEPARVQRRLRGAECNPRPMSRKYREMFAARIGAPDRDPVLVDRDRLALAPVAHRGAHGPREQRDFEAGERQHWPQSLDREQARDREGRSADDRNEDPGAGWGQRAARSQ